MDEISREIDFRISYRNYFHPFWVKVVHMRKKFYTALSFYHTEIGMAVVEKFYDSDLNSARFYELFTPFDESFISFEILIVACTASD